MSANGEVAVEQVSMQDARILLAGAQRQQQQRADVMFQEFLQNLSDFGFRLSIQQLWIDGRPGDSVIGVIPK